MFLSTHTSSFTLYCYVAFTFPGHIGMHDQATYATDSVAAIIMMVFQYTDKEGWYT